MITLEGGFEEINKRNKTFSIKSSTGLTLKIKDDHGEILHIICSSQYTTTIARVTIHGEMAIDLGKDKNIISIQKGTIIIKRV